MMAKKKFENRPQQQSRDGRSNKKCFNLGKKRNYITNYCSTSKKKPEDEKANQKAK